MRIRYQVHFYSVMDDDKVLITDFFFISVINDNKVQKYIFFT